MRAREWASVGALRRDPRAARRGSGPADQSGGRSRPSRCSRGGSRRRRPCGTWTLVGTTADGAEREMTARDFGLTPNEPRPPPAARHAAGSASAAASSGRPTTRGRARSRAAVTAMRADVTVMARPGVPPPRHPRAGARTVSWARNEAARSRDGIATGSSLAPLADLAMARIVVVLILVVLGSTAAARRGSRSRRPAVFKPIAFLEAIASRRSRRPRSSSASRRSRTRSSSRRARRRRAAGPRGHLRPPAPAGGAGELARQGHARDGARSSARSRSWRSRRAIARCRCAPGFAGRPAASLSPDARWPIELAVVVLAAYYWKAGVSEARSTAGSAWADGATLQYYPLTSRMAWGTWLAGFPAACAALADVLARVRAGLAARDRAAAALDRPRRRRGCFHLGTWLFLGITFWPLVATYLVCVPWTRLATGLTTGLDARVLASRSTRLRVRGSNPGWRGRRQMQEVFIVASRAVRRSAAERAGSPGSTPPTCSAPCSRPRVERAGIDPRGDRPDRRRLRLAGGRAVVQHRAHGLALAGPAARGRRRRRSTASAARRQQATTLAAGLIGAGIEDLVLACGVEMMTRVPLGSNMTGGSARCRSRYRDALRARVAVPGRRR